MSFFNADGERRSPRHAGLDPPVPTSPSSPSINPPTSPSSHSSTSCSSSTSVPAQVLYPNLWSLLKVVIVPMMPLLIGLQLLPANSNTTISPIVIKVSPCPTPYPMPQMTHQSQILHQLVISLVLDGPRTLIQAMTTSIGGWSTLTQVYFQPQSPPICLDICMNHHHLMMGMLAFNLYLPKLMSSLH